MKEELRDEGVSFFNWNNWNWNGFPVRYSEGIFCGLKNISYLCTLKTER